MAVSTVTITLDIVVHDPKKLRRLATERYQETWHDEDWRPDSLGEAAFEVLIGSSPGAAPADLGFEINDYAWSGD